MLFRLFEYVSARESRLVYKRIRDRTVTDRIVEMSKSQNVEFF